MDDYKRFMPHKQNACKKAEKYGIDVSLIEVNLNKTYTQRIIDFQKALQLVEILKKAGIKYYGRLHKTP